MRKHIGILLFTMFLVALSLPAFCGGYGTLTSNELKVMIDRNEPGLVIIDSRSQSQYEEAHIKGALSIPLDVMEKSPELPGVQKDARIAFYCSGAT
jgi:rhodanese-related sulfurtransferase